LRYIEFGKIVNTHALKGEIKVYSYTDNVKNILALKEVYISDIRYEVEKSRYNNNMFTFKLKGVDNINAAEAMVNLDILRRVTDSELNEDNSYFIQDLLNTKVYLESGEEFGILTDVFQTGANDVYEVTKKDGGTILLPAIESVIKDVNLEENKIKVHIMEGL
jgi:16S rRNA processing protein RimM